MTENKNFKAEDAVHIQLCGPENVPVTIWYNRRHKIFKISHDHSGEWNQVLEGKDAESAIQDWATFIATATPV